MRCRATPRPRASCSPAWHTLCLNHKAYRDELLAQAREVVTRYETPGLFFDIVLTPDCVCPACIETMAEMGLDPENPADRLKNDEWVNERFRSEMSAALRAEFPGPPHLLQLRPHPQAGAEALRRLYAPRDREPADRRLGLRSLPLERALRAPSSASISSATPASSTRAGASSAASSSPRRWNTRRRRWSRSAPSASSATSSIPTAPSTPTPMPRSRPPIARIAALEPFLEGGRHVPEVAILSAEYFQPVGARNNVSDDGAAQMLLELQRPFDVIDPSARFADYPLILLPDDDPRRRRARKASQATTSRNGGRILFSGASAIDADGDDTAAGGHRAHGAAHRLLPDLSARQPRASTPACRRRPLSCTASRRRLPREAPTCLPRSPRPTSIAPTGTSRRTSTRPTIPMRRRSAPAVTVFGNVAYIAYPIFDMYQAMGQPLYKYIVRGLLDRLLPDRILVDRSALGRPRQPRGSARARPARPPSALWPAAGARQARAGGRRRGAGHGNDRGHSGDRPGDGAGPAAAPADPGL